MASQDDFSAYENFLDTEVWPSSGTKENGAPLKPVFGYEQMMKDAIPPQYASACLAKLVRWAVMEPKGHTASIPDATSREEHVRDSRLGMALAARACNLRSIGEFDALYRYEHKVVPGQIFRPSDTVVDVDPSALVADIAVKLHEEHTASDQPANLKRTIASVHQTITTLLELGFKVTWTER